MDLFWQEITRGIPDGAHLTIVLIRLITAAAAGAMIGYERQLHHKSAGLRTHILVALGACLFLITGSLLPMTPEGVSRVIQGIATGIGFIGAGAIIKLSTDYHIRGLTTSASIWITAAIGVTIGLGMIGIGLIVAVIALVVLTVLRRLEIKDDDTPVPIKKNDL